MSTSSYDFNLTPTDLNQLINIVDLAARRGAFQVEEFSVVAAVYSKLKKFVELNKPELPVNSNGNDS